MSKSGRDWFRVGERDGENNRYEPPHESSLPTPIKEVAELFGSRSDEEIADRDDYRRGFRAGRDNN